MEQLTPENLKRDTDILEGNLTHQDKYIINKRWKRAIKEFAKKSKNEAMRKPSKKRQKKDK